MLSDGKEVPDPCAAKRAVGDGTQTGAVVLEPLCQPLSLARGHIRAQPSVYAVDGNRREVTFFEEALPMFTAYVAVTALTAAANTYAATADLIRPTWLLGNMAKARVPQSWLLPLAALKAAGALGLLVGIAVAPLGVAASTGLILFFVGALITHFRARYWEIAAPVAFLLLAVGSLVLRMASS
jgi:hypothetical protein